MANNIKNFTELDFDGIKSSLIDFMKSKQESGKLEGFEFEGSTMNILMDLLAYNTQYNAFYLNQLASERFIGTAQKRESLVNIAKNLGYTPRSVKPAISCLELVVTPSEIETPQQESIAIPRGTKFNTKIEDESFTFYSSELRRATLTQDGIYVVEDFEIRQGKELEYTERVSGNGVVLPNKGVDTSRIRVFVSNTEANLGEEFFNDNIVTEIQRDTNQFFVEEVEGELHRIYFGDDVIGRSAIDGQFVTVFYSVSDGTEGNGATIFDLSSPIEGVSDVVIRKSTISTNGGDIETLDSIRVSAPAFFQRQNRAVTASDFASIVKQLVPDALDVFAFGGEDRTNPIFGVVFISILQKRFEDVISDSRKNAIERTLKDRFAGLSITPKVVVPELFFLDIKTLVTYDSSQPNPGADVIKEGARAAALDHLNNNVLRFNKSFRLSKFVSDIDKSNSSIISNRTEVTVFTEFTSAVQLATIEDFSLNQRLVPGSVRTGTFKFGGEDAIIEPSDIDNTILDLKIIAPDLTKVTVQQGVVQLDYNTGDITILADRSNFNAVFFEISTATPLTIFAEVEYGDVIASNAAVVAFRESNIKVEVEDIQTGAVTGFINFN